MGPFLWLAGCVLLIALLVVYVPTIYIRQSNKVLKALDQIAANTQRSRQHNVA